MSYHVRLEIAWDGEGPDPFTKAAQKKIRSCVEAYLRAAEAEGWLEWREEFGRAFAGGAAEIKGLDEEWATALLAHVSGRFPGTGFWARGIGEEINDVWAILVRDGEVEWSASLTGGSRGRPPEADTGPAWPGPLDVARVVAEAGLRKFLAEILAGQSPTAEVGALTLKRRKGRKPPALVHVGPLDRAALERIIDLFEDRYQVQSFRDARTLLDRPVATADQPQGY
jgi:hypothetical protein